MSKITELPFDFTTLYAAFSNGLSVTELVREVYRRIYDANDDGIFLHLSPEEKVLEAARALRPLDLSTKPLWGLPFAVKDNIDTAGDPTTAACPEFSYLAEKDAFVVKQLRSAGALLIGKTNLDQFATGLVGVRSPYPAPKNAIDPEIVPGGSSSGSAVAVAKGLISFSLGTDTAGSGRVPAALNNIVGLKPTLGSLSTTGLVPACRTLDTISIFALTVADAYQIFEITAVYDPHDSYAREISPKPMQNLPPVFCVGVPDQKSRKFFGDIAQEKSFEDSLSAITQYGGEIIEIDFTPFFDIAHMLYEGAWVAERYVAIADLLNENPDAIHPVTRDVICKAEHLSAADAFKGIYKLQELKRRVQPALESLDMLCVPTIPSFYSLNDLALDPIGPNSRLGTYTNFVNLLDLCAIAVPISPRIDDRPGGVTLLAKAGEDHIIASLAALLHENAGVSLGGTKWKLPVTSKAENTVNDDEIALAAVGAHMSGLPLNGELVRLGGRYIKTTCTAPSYTLHKLAGGPPYRPGLMRNKNGSSIELEIWALPSAKFGEFMRGVPEPLGIGTITLQDGSTVNGFICEAEGLEGSLDITKFGGWRNFLPALSA